MIDPFYTVTWERSVRMECRRCFHLAVVSAATALDMHTFIETEMDSTTTSDHKAESNDQVMPP